MKVRLEMVRLVRLKGVSLVRLEGVSCTQAEPTNQKAVFSAHPLNILMSR